jgi:hypothetical protein
MRKSEFLMLEALKSAPHLNNTSKFWREEKLSKKIGGKIKMAYVHQPI